MGLMPPVGSVPGNMLGSGDEKSHIVQFYDDDSFLIETLGRSLVPILAGGDSAVVIGTAQHRLALAQALEAGGINVSEAAKAGRYVAQDASESLAQFMLDGLPNAARFSAYF